MNFLDLESTIDVGLSQAPSVLDEKEQGNEAEIVRQELIDVQQQPWYMSGLEFSN